MANIKIGETGGISVVDFGAFLDGSRKQEVADAIVQSFKNIGFVYLVNHGLAQQKVESMFDWVRPSYLILPRYHSHDIRSQSVSSISQQR